MELDDDKGDFVLKGTFDHPYPTTNILWAPAGNTFGKDLLATTGDYLRLWNVGDDGEIRLECLLNNVSAAAHEKVRVLVLAAVFSSALFEFLCAPEQEQRVLRTSHIVRLE